MVNGAPQIAKWTSGFAAMTVPGLDSSQSVA